MPLIQLQMIGATTTYLTILIQFDSNRRWNDWGHGRMVNNSSI